ncbi:hypothetical protein [Mesorhizobium sp. SP-1A]|uniref:hypothetical protein n=1 Tax=Mesorhizobium sp. SP-1A TaxID=3077840 RepID=UPI0028F70ECD|nr:hypothetical protein [Mesorhizobium sp. SP-1A]
MLRTVLCLLWDSELPVDIFLYVDQIAIVRIKFKDVFRIQVEVVSGPLLSEGQKLIDLHSYTVVLSCIYSFHISNPCQYHFSRIAALNARDNFRYLYGFSGR